MTGGRQPRALPVMMVAAALLIVAWMPIATERGGGTFQDVDGRDRGRQLSEIHNRRAFSRGLLPLWDPVQFGGRPHLANAQTHVLYPLRFFTRLLPVDWFFVASAVLHAWAAGLGAYLVARHLGLMRVASAAAGAAVMLASVMAPVVDLPHSPIPIRLAWIPLALAFAMRTSERQSCLPHPGLVLVLSVAILAGSMRGILYVLGAVCGWLLFAACLPAGRTCASWRQLAQLALLTTCLGFGLTAVQTVPFVRFWLSAHGTSVVSDSGDNQHPAPAGARDRSVGGRVAAVLASSRRGRVISTCGGEIDAELAASGIPLVFGRGGPVPRDYLRFIRLAGAPVPPGGELFAAREPEEHVAFRPDLVRLLDATYLVSCRPADPRHWMQVAVVGGVGIYRIARPLGRAVWTCDPRRVGPKELEYRLGRQRYDASLSLRAAGPPVHVRWRIGIDEAERVAAETDFDIVRERFLGDRTWQYELTDPSRSRLAAIVTSDLVDDTAGIDRSAFEVVPLPSPQFDEPASEWLMGAEPCGGIGRAVARIQDREDGRLVIAVDGSQDGVVFLSETYSAERIAWVDGRRVQPLRVNLAFTAIPVPEGQHRIEVKYDARPLWLGAGVSAMSLVLWGYGAVRCRSGSAIGDVSAAGSIS